MPSTVSDLSELAGSPVPSSSCIDLPEIDFDLNTFLQSCSEFMSQPLTPSPVFHVPPILPNPAVSTPPYTSDEGSVAGDCNLDLDHQPKIKLTHRPVASVSAIPQITLTMSSNRQFNAYQSPDPSNPSSSSMSLRTSQSSSRSQSPPSLTYSYSNPNIFASYPQSYPTTDYFPQQHPQIIPPSANSHAGSPPWQTTDTEANASGLDVDLDVDLEGMTDEGTGKLSYSTASPGKSLKVSGKDSIPRPPNAWILYRSDILKDLASGNDIPGLDAVLTKLGYGPVTSASSDESTNESVSATKGKSKEATDSEMMPPPSTIKVKKSKKGVKQPTEEFLSLGRGKTGKGLPQAHISKLISTLWKNETEERKAFYERKADLRKIEHQKKYPDYKFQPMRKADKIRQREEREREREELKRQKEAEKQAGKAKRHQRRQRNRVSPSSPYSVMNSTKRPDTGSLARSLTYSGESSKNGDQWWANAGPSAAYGGPRRETEPAPSRYALGADPLGVYPFPVPIDALPALAPDDSSIMHQQGTPSAMIAEDYHSWQHRQNHGHPQPHPMFTPAPSAHMESRQRSHTPRAPAMSHQSSSDIHPSLRPPTQAQQSIPHPQPPQVEEVPPQPMHGLGVYPSMHSAVPFIADPLPMDAHGRPMAILGLDDIQPFPEDDNGDPAMLAEMWWNLQDEDVRDDLENATGPSGLLADERTLQVYDINADEAGRSSAARVSITPTDVPSGSNSAAPLTPSTTFLPQEPLGIPAGEVAYPYPQGFVPMYVSVIPEDGNIDPSIPFFAPGYDANLSYLPMDATLDPSLFVPIDEQGPFLSTQQPMSPTESWSAGPTPREATFLRAAGPESTRIPSNSSEGTVRTVSSNQQSAPRYVSNSAYPLTPSSQDPTALPGTGGGIVDRNTSYSALAAVMSGQTMGIGMSMGGADDMLGWDDNDVIEHSEEDEENEQEGSQQQRKEKGNNRIPTPISASASTPRPRPEQTQAQVKSPYDPKSIPDPQKEQSQIPRKHATRSRAVASKFNGDGGV
ncbi:hypothetical protein I203_106745 [Kwoniella mangroviensis CBS 8507]|uniref:uncharacterized protein n=1 Tax=Kwoniella mangroviensis CBS 8507 TaxID=1296122 RepID=UPI00080D32E9|nr:uncharacterized protein I203_07832 [Kwoniella mangroviensis CBS 8507]OCF63096.1 hypothetical protein I203_07832 [Kwoniella mangroviensis CBS 8507]